MCVSACEYCYLPTPPTAEVEREYEGKKEGGGGREGGEKVIEGMVRYRTGVYFSPFLLLLALR